MVSLPSRSTYPHANFVIGIAFFPDSHRHWVHHVDLQEVRRRRVRVVQSLFFNIQTSRRVRRRVLSHHNFFFKTKQSQT